MLIEFEVGNYLSFNAPVRLSMVAANPIKEYLEENTFQAGRHRLLKSAVVYGANASGKSNLLAAMAFMRTFVLNSSKEMQVEEEIRVMPFKLEVSTKDKPSHFEVCFLWSGFRYRYGFQVDRKRVRREWLFRTEKVKEDTLFLREDDGIDVREGFREGKGLEDKTRDNALFLSVAAQFNGTIAGDVVKWFINFRSLHGLRDQTYERYSTELLQKEEMRPLLVEFIRRADVGIEDLIVNEVLIREDDLKDVPDETRQRLMKQRQFKIATVHKSFRDGVEEGITHLDFASEESEGTKKFFRIAGPILDCLKNGYIVAVDELDAKLHPHLTRAIARLFNSPVSNPKNAQLIFATHDTNLLHYGNLRRDQVWFVEKTNQSASSLYSLAEFKSVRGTKVRNDAALEKNYIQGRFGAIPYLGDFSTLLKEAGDGTPSQTE
jgi:AAA15 family ATPase/GTPase